MRSEWRFVLPSAIKASVPVLLGYITLGIAFGLTLVAANFPWWLAPIMAVFVYAGAAQFMAIGLLQQGASLAEIALLTFLMNARHMVYGLSLLTPFSQSGAWKPYLVFGLTDETYGLLTTVKAPPTVNKTKFYAAVTMLNQSYWILGCTIGALVGSALRFDTTGLDFALTALFIVLLVEQMRVVKQPEPYIATLVACLVALLVSPRNFLLIALALATGIMALLRSRVEARSANQETTIHSDVSHSSNQGGDA